MDLHDAIIYLNDEKNVLKCSSGHIYQRYNKDNVYRIYSKNSEEYSNGSIGGTIKNMDFIKENIKSIFDKELQFYQKEMTFPMLCKVKESGWSSYKTVCFNSFSGTMFSTGFGESYLPTVRTEIIPLNKKEIKSFIH